VKMKSFFVLVVVSQKVGEVRGLDHQYILPVTVAGSRWPPIRSEGVGARRERREGFVHGHAASFDRGFRADAVGQCESARFSVSNSA
jgi:hypothetical protein